MFGQLEYYLNVFKGRIDWPDLQRMDLQNELAKLKDGTQVYVRIGRLSAPKTNAQIKGFFGLFTSRVISEFNDRGYDTSYLYKTPNPTGIPISKDLLKEYMYNVCPVYRDNRRMTISGMSVEEMSEFYENCCNFAASQWNIYIPETDKEWKKKKIESITDIKEYK